MGSTERFDEVLDQLRVHGRRITSPRRAILEALVEHDGHPTAEQLMTVVHDRQPDVDKSTVYRFLEDLEGLGLVDHVHLGHGPAVYHFTDEGHHHLVCETCGVVLEVPRATFDQLRQRLQEQFGFDLEARHFAVPGRCRSCSA